MRSAVLLVAVAALAACSEQETPPPAGNTAEDYASRVGAAAPASGNAQAAASAGKTVAPRALETAPGQTAYSMQQLGDASSVDLGPKSGSCIFVTGGSQMMQVSAPVDRTLPGKAAVRIGGRLLKLDGPPGVVNLAKMGGDYEGEGFRVEVRPDGRGGARVTTVDIEGESHILNGDWKCT